MHQLFILKDSFRSSAFILYIPLSSDQFKYRSFSLVYSISFYPIKALVVTHSSAYYHVVFTGIYTQRRVSLFTLPDFLATYSHLLTGNRTWTLSFHIELLKLHIISYFDKCHFHFTFEISYFRKSFLFWVKLISFIYFNLFEGYFGTRSIYFLFLIIWYYYFVQFYLVIVEFYTCLFYYGNTVFVINKYWNLMIFCFISN